MRESKPGVVSLEDRAAAYLAALASTRITKAAYSKDLVSIIWSLLVKTT